MKRFKVNVSVAQQERVRGTGGSTALLTRGEDTRSPRICKGDDLRPGSTAQTPPGIRWECPAPVVPLQLPSQHKAMCPSPLHGPRTLRETPPNPQGETCGSTPSAFVTTQSGPSQPSERIPRYCGYDREAASAGVVQMRRVDRRENGERAGHSRAAGIKSAVCVCVCMCAAVLRLVDLIVLVLFQHTLEPEMLRFPMTPHEVLPSHTMTTSV